MKLSLKPSQPSPLTDSGLTDTELVDYWLQWAKKQPAMFGSIARDIQFCDVHVGTVGGNRPSLTREMLSEAVARSITARITAKLKS